VNLANVVVAACKAAIGGSLLTKRVCLLGLLATYLGAFVTPACAHDNWIVTRMDGAIRPEVTWEQVKSQMLTAFYQSNPDERGVSAQGIDDLRKIAIAQRRSQAIAQILNYDLDGDGKVTKEEIIAVMQPRARQMIQAHGVQLEPTPEQVRIQLDKLVNDLLKLDADHDGVISAAEIQQEGTRQAEQMNIAWQRGPARFVPLALDANGDGVVSLAEYEAAVRRYFDAIDQNRDGRISASEAKDANKRSNDAQQAIQRAREAEVRRQRLEAAVADCNVPSAPRDVRFVFVGGGEGRALSNAWIGSEDRVTHVVTVEVNPGPEPLYLALASEGATIWDVRGATDRIVGLVAHANTAAERSGDSRGFDERRGQPLVGVMGLPRDKIHFTAYTGCLVPPTKHTLEDGSAQEAAALLLGRPADEIDGKVSVGTFTVPAIQHLPDRPVRNAIPLPKEGLGELLWRNVLGDYPEGVAQIDVGSVVSPLPVKSCSILPGNAGLAELVDAGH
jgi:Ca2+-binding EF-hand superfamily protein